MKILSAAQIREADAHTISNEPIASIDLMERASLAFTHWFTDRFDNTNTIKVFCGTGNNGGDGLAIARLLSLRGYHVETFVIRSSDKQSDDFGVNFNQLSKSSSIVEIQFEDQLPEIKNSEIVIDALFGSGLTRPLEGLFAETVNYINSSETTIVSVDIPSGLFCDKQIEGNSAIKANHTVSFQVPKLAFFLPANFDFVGEWHVVDIGLDKEFIENSSSIYSTIDAEFIKQNLLPKQKSDHKGTNGKALLIAGSYGKMGAAVLAGKAALRSGLGLLTIHAPHCGYTILQSTVPEAMVFPDPTEFYFGEIPETDNNITIGVGPGLDTKQKTAKAFEELLQKVAVPMVIDADALNLLSINTDLLSLIPKNSILTPHHKEFERLVGSWEDDIYRINKQLLFSEKHNVIVVFKGANTTITTPEGETYFNTTGNPGMAKGGSGDVLTGILTGLLGQGYNSQIAAQMGVYLHGLAGDIAKNKKGNYGMIASDIIDGLPEAFKLFS